MEVKGHWITQFQNFDWLSGHELSAIVKKLDHCIMQFQGFD